MLLALFFLFSLDVRSAAQTNSLSNQGSGKTSSFITPDEITKTTLYNTPWLVTVATKPVSFKTQSVGSNTPLRAGKSITEEALRQYLEAKNSPLAPYSALILQSPYWSTILGICTIEQYSCSRLPYGNNWNLWGIMRPGGGLHYFETAEAGLDAINLFLERAETSRGRPTIESFRGWYCYAGYTDDHTCPNWEPTVLRVRKEVEAL